MTKEELSYQLYQLLRERDCLLVKTNSINTEIARINNEIISLEKVNASPSES